MVQIVQTGASLCIRLTSIKLIMSLLLLASALAIIGQSLRPVVHEPVQDAVESLDLPATY
jgi:hypothetical protein